MWIRHPQPCFWKHDFATQYSFRLLLQFLTTSTQFFYFHFSTHPNCVYWPNSPGIAPWISSSVSLFINFQGLPQPRFLTKIPVCSNHFANQLLPGFLPRFCFSLTFRFYPNPVFDQNPKVQCHERVYSRWMTVISLLHVPNGVLVKIKLYPNPVFWPKSQSAGPWKGI